MLCYDTLSTLPPSSPSLWALYSYVKKPQAKQELINVNIIIGFRIFTLAPLFDLTRFAAFGCFFDLIRLIYYSDLIRLTFFGIWIDSIFLIIILLDSPVYNLTKLTSFLFCLDSNIFRFDLTQLSIDFIWLNNFLIWLDSFNSYLT